LLFYADYKLRSGLPSRTCVNYTLASQLTVFELVCKLKVVLVVLLVSGKVRHSQDQKVKESVRVREQKEKVEGEKVHPRSVN
jgi:hypothetical protein